MYKSYNLALVLIRCYGLAALFGGSMWLVNLVGAFVLKLLGVPDAFLWSMPMASQSFLSSLVWVLAGFLILRYSRWIASFVARGTMDPP
jgi:hypothetical protein